MQNLQVTNYLPEHKKHLSIQIYSPKGALNKKKEISSHTPDSPSWQRASSFWGSTFFKAEERLLSSLCFEDGEAEVSSWSPNTDPQP